MVRNLINKILNKNLKYNILSLCNVMLGFLFILYLGRKFGSGKETDTYFLSVVVVTYLGNIIQSVWEAMGPYYVELKIKNKNLSDKLYSILLNNLIIISTLLIILYFVVTNFFNIISIEYRFFLDKFIFYLLFQNIILYNKTVLMLEHWYASFYTVDIFINFMLILIVFFISEKQQFVFIAFGYVVSALIVSIWQFYLIFKRLNIKYSLKIYDKMLKEIYINSFKLKIGSLLYGLKDIIIASVFTNFGNGIYSLYSYASKFAGVIVQIVNAPILNIFSIKANYYIANKQYNLLKLNIKKVLIETIFLFVVSAIIVYIMLPVVITVLFNNKLNVLIIQKIYSIIIFFNLILVIQSPYGRLLVIVKEFNFSIVINIVFIFIILISYFIFKYFNFSYELFLWMVVLAQLVQFMYIFFYIKRTYDDIL
jgi:O-antigen/teichoic acid export membrane protein